MSDPDLKRTVDSAELNAGKEKKTRSGLRNSRRSRWIASGLVIAAFVAIGLFFFFRQPQLTVQPPKVDLPNADSSVAVAIQRAYDRVIERPHVADAWGRYGMCLYAHDLLAAADTCFRRAQELDPGDYRWPYLIGICVMFSDPVQGLQQFQRSAELRPDLAFVRLRTAEMAIDLNQLELAKDNIQATLRIEPQNPRANLAAARLAQRRGDSEQAESKALLAVKYGPEFRMPYELLARIQFQQQQHEKANEYLTLMNQATRSDDWPDPVITQVMGMRRDLSWLLTQIQKQRDAGRKNEVLTSLKKLLADYPESVDVRMELARTSLDVGRPDEAAKLIEDGIRQQPGAARLHRLKGGLLYQQGKFSEAAECFRAAIDLKPDFALAYDNLGTSLIELQKPEAALNAFRKAVELQPDLPGVHEKISRLESGSGSD